jgi:microcompartment protein CcmL/EutN
MARAFPPSHQTDPLEDVGSAKMPALAFIELSSISRGIYLTDVVIKKAPVRIITSQPISSGKHVLLFVGDNASVEESHGAALAAADGTIVRQVLIPGVHPALAPFLDSIWSADAARNPIGDSVAIVESTSLAGAILSADQALKTADVQLCRMRLGQGIGGKAFFVISGKQEEVEAAVDAANICLRQLDSYCRTDVIPRPETEALAYL